MHADLECGVCYRTYNTGRRCPRELRCKHGFCESCLLALSRPAGPGELEAGGRTIMCPLCRHPTPLSGEGKVRAELRVDEGVLERLIAAGVLDEDEEEEEEEQEGCGDVNQEATLPESQAEEGDSFAGSRGGRLRRSMRSVWRKISGKSSRQRRAENCMTNADLRNLAIMSCHMF